MTTQVELVCGDIPQLTSSAYQLMESLVETLNFYSPTSALSKLNQGKKNTWIQIPEVLWEIISLAKQLEKATQGWFRIEFEGMGVAQNGEHFIELKEDRHIKIGTDTLINLGGIGKGFIVDKVATYLEANGSSVYLINAGGDLRAKSTTHPWKIGLQNPLHSDQLIGHIAIHDGAIVSSGTYARERIINGEKKSHFFNPFLKEYMENPPYQAVTVEGPSAMQAEVWAKTVLMGHPGPYPKELKLLTIDAKTHRVKVINALTNPLHMPISYPSS